MVIAGGSAAYEVLKRNTTYAARSALSQVNEDGSTSIPIDSADGTDSLAPYQPPQLLSSGSGMAMKPTRQAREELVFSSTAADDDETKGDVHFIRRALETLEGDEGKDAGPSSSLREGEGVQRPGLVVSVVGMGRNASQSAVEVASAAAQVYGGDARVVIERPVNADGTPQTADVTYPSLSELRSMQSPVSDRGTVQ